MRIFNIASCFYEFCCSIVAIALGLLIFSDVLTVDADTPIIGGFPTLFAWIINGLGFVKIVDKGVIDVYIDKNVDVFLRKSLI